MTDELFESTKQALTDGFVKRAGVTQEVAASMATEIVNTLEDLEKSASIQGDLFGKTIAQQARPFVDMAAKRGAEVLGGLAAAGLVGSAYLGAKKALGSHQNDMQYRAFQNAVQKARSLSTVLQRADDAKVARLADTIFKYAPTAASDPHLLSSVLSLAVSGDGLDMMTVKMLVDLEKAHSGVNAPSVSMSHFLRG